MSTPSKRKGSKAELDVVKYLRKEGWKHAERRLAGNSQDRGDVAGVPNVCFEIKDHKAKDLAGWTEELIVEIKNAKAETGTVVHKRRGKSNPADWYATMPLSIYIELLKKAGY